MLMELVDFYHQALKSHPEDVPTFGWCITKVANYLYIDMDGEIVAVVLVVDQNKMKSIVPAQSKRASGISANFLCDKSAYILGHESKSSRRLEEKFEAARTLHRSVLGGVDSDCARAVLRYFERGRPSLEHPVLASADESLFSGGNIAIRVQKDGYLLDPLSDEAIRGAWEHYYFTMDFGEAMRCLVTGELAQIERIHPAIKGVYGAQSSGASVVSFNQRAFESYGYDKEQGRNAPVSRGAAHAYTTALNYLLASKKHHTRLGDATIVYWSDRKDEQNSQMFSMLMGVVPTGDDGAQRENADMILDATMKAVAKGNYRDMDGIDLDATFCVLGLAPSKSRIVVRFFLKDSFGRMLDNIAKHYRRSSIVHGPREREHLTPYQLLQDVEHPKAKKPVVVPILSGPLLQSILEDTPYPQALYNNALLRIHATQEDPDTHTRKVTRARAAIIRAYLIKNVRKKGFEEEAITVSLNEERVETAYCLGRAFAILEQIQEEANGRATITNRYFNAASTTPAIVYPSIIRLSDAHLAKIERAQPRLAVYLKKQLYTILGEDRVTTFPKRLSLEEQGDFILGYIHQRNKRYEGKNAGSDEVTNNNGSEEE